MLLIFRSVFLDFVANDQTAYFQFQREVLKFLNFVSISVAKLKSVFCWGIEQVIHQGRILPPGKKAGTVLPYCKAQFPSEPQPPLARLSQLACSRVTALPSGQHFRSGGCSQGAHSKDVRNTCLIILGRYLENSL